MVDLGAIVDKLEAAGLVKHDGKDLYGDFSIKEHAHLLTPQELKMWLAALHMGTPSHEKNCTDLHRWHFKAVNEVPES